MSAKQPLAERRKLEKERDLIAARLRHVEAILARLNTIVFAEATQPGKPPASHKPQRQF